ncbi:hypothetical protein LSAT2_021947 [Lamellibrachia satsuma]|nr:hypothetical protein LSAT2_021947 [Lamellibrachia satsuma]
MDVKLSVGRSGVAVLLLLAIFCCQSPETTTTHVDWYIRCLSMCTKDAKECMHHCEENNSCASALKICKKLCFSKLSLCEMRCFDGNGR